jgi:DMSO/TMAO reductase YedYZ molybdopterin-dependent catalytic subunit
MNPDMKEKIYTARQVRWKSIFAFSFFILAFSAGVYVWKSVRAEPKDEGIPKTLRKGLSANEKIFSAVFSKNKLVKTYPTSEAVKLPRFNGWEGLRSPLDSAGWRLNVVKKNGDTVSFTMEDIKKLPKTEVVFDFKCIEGWSQKTWWGGVKFSDFINYYHLDAEAQMSYAGMITPDHGYYVGLDMPSVMHPQTLLCYEMNGKELPLNQGYPLRLIIPVKYGIKHIKRIGTIFFSNMRPPDYWAERGYDYYAGH